MKPEIKAKWCEALRSGKFKQGRYRLYNPVDDTYCCLGVLEFIVSGEKPTSGNALPSQSTVNISRLNEKSPKVKWENGEYQLTILNDCFKLSFSRIAALIEEQL